MKFSCNAANARRLRFGAAAVAIVVASFSAGLLVLSGNAQAAATSVPLGTAESFVVLAGAGITNTGATTLDGDIGTYPTQSITGTATMTITGTNHAGDAVTQGAKTDLVTAYGVAAGQGPTSPISADLGGQTLVPGVYNSASSLGLTGALTLDAEGDPNAVFVFQAGSTLTAASGSQVVLINGTQACNVFWQIGSSATLGTGSMFRGSILAQTSITVTTGVVIIGRVLALDGAVTLDTNTISKPSCTTVPPTSTMTPTDTATSTATVPPTSSTSPTDTSTPTSSATPTETVTTGTVPPTSSATPTETSTPTDTSTPTETGSSTKTPTQSASPTETSTSTGTSTSTTVPTDTATSTETTATSTDTTTPTVTTTPVATTTPAGGVAGQTGASFVGVSQVPMGAVGTGDGSSVTSAWSVADWSYGREPVSSCSGSVVSQAISVKTSHSSPQWQGWAAWMMPLSAYWAN
jgi:hypothetical protein